jgi:hypothetical protein
MTSSPPSNGPWLEAEWVKLTTSFALHVPLATMCSGSDPPVWKWSKLPPPCALLALKLPSPWMIIRSDVLETASKTRKW